MPVLQIDVNHKKTTYNHRGGDIICCNSDYSVKFNFDEEWDGVDEKIGIFVWAGGRERVPFTGDTCPVPTIHSSRSVMIGVCSASDPPIATTAVVVGCVPSILSVAGVEKE